MGGVPCAINLDETGAVGAVNMERLNLVSSIIQKARQFCEQVYLPDVLLIASYYKDWAKIGGGLSSMNLLAYGEFPDNLTIIPPVIFCFRVGLSLTVVSTKFILSI